MYDKLPLMAVVGDPFLKIFGPCPIFGTSKARHFKYGVQINYGNYTIAFA